MQELQFRIVETGKGCPFICSTNHESLAASVVQSWPLVPKFAGSNPAETVGFFRTKQILSTPSFGREIKPFVPCRIFKARKRTRNRVRGSRSFRSKLPAISRPSISPFHYQGLWWRHLVVQVGTTKDQGLYNKPKAYCTNTTIQYNHDSFVV